MAALGILGLLAIPLLLVLIFFVGVALFQWLWNITMPDVFNLRTVTFWQAFRLLLLAAILFSGQRVVEKTTQVGERTVSAYSSQIEAKEDLQVASGSVDGPAAHP
ncbi:MAG: hypothetical protein ACE5JX_09145 [Acidobacteriota bacterium]